MMKMILFLLFLIPVSFNRVYWLIQWFFFISTFMFTFYLSFNYMFQKLSYGMGLDLLSYSLSLLTLWICSLMILASSKLFKINYYYNLFLVILLFLLLSLLITFFSLNLFLFYLFFEVSLIPTLILIIGWGYQPERIEAGVYLLFYTMIASLPMLVSIFYCYNNFNSLEFYYLNNIFSGMVYIIMILVFLVKMPMFLVHLWLPKAHVEAPVAGSMILAGIMLKLGGYGLLRVMKMFLIFNCSLNIFFISISLLGSVLVSLICIRQSDLKSLIAYSSVSHMGLVLAGIMTLNIYGAWGSLVLMLGHGLCSSGLFCLANISYERISSRSLYMNKGLMNILPSLSLWWFLFCIFNMAAPPSINLFGEILLINSLISFSKMSMFMLMLISFFSAVYSLYLYSFSQHGSYSSSVYSYHMGSYVEYLLLFLHWIPLLFLILKPDLISLWI
uniref:NADH-ubiquinone oxidoreductase chain 4 n=1 Tax=Lepidapion squamigerum TaxID=280314 RepID=A0A6B9ETJ8_9CUCU|nr:NADH dehydrogenase subunit 4 [Lepidapion squamigerum]